MNKPYKVDRVAEEAHRLASSANAALWASFLNQLSGSINRNDVEQLIDLASGDVTTLEAARERVAERYPDAAAIGARKLLQRATLLALRGTVE